MRKEQFGIGVYAHVMKRGAHKMPIVRDDADRWRFLKLLRYVNDENTPSRWEREVTPALLRQNFARPKSWKSPKPYVSILSYCLMENHFHLLLCERTESGIATFMQRLCRSMAAHYNAKYESSGALFQGPYVARVVEEDEYLQYLASYINVKNTFELYPNGFDAARQNFDAAYTWAVRYPFSSTADFAGTRSSNILDVVAVRELFQSPQKFCAYSKDVMDGRLAFGDEVRALEID